MGRLDGRVILITGGAGGQGAAESRMCVEEGATVALADVVDDAGRAVAEEIGATYVHLDVAVADDWSAAVATVVDRHGRIDGLVNNAGIFEMRRMLETDETLYRRIVDVNQVGVFLGMAAVAPHMIAALGGSIVNISSIAGMKSAPVAFAYSASKWAVRGMTKSAAAELGRHGIRVNSVHPGFIDTAMLEDLAGIGGDWRERLRRQVPLGRLATADDVASVVLFLLSDDSSYCTGQEFVVDGGVIA